MEKIEGKVWKFRDSIDTDVIIAGRYLRTFSLDDLSAHVMEAEDPEFADKVQKDDIIVAGWNFGCGSSGTSPSCLETCWYFSNNCKIICKDIL